MPGVESGPSKIDELRGQVVAGGMSETAQELGHELPEASEAPIGEGASSGLEGAAKLNALGQELGRENPVMEEPEDEELDKVA